MKAQGAKEGKDSGSGGKQSTPQDKKKTEPPAPTPAKREDVVFDVTDKTLQKVGAGSASGVFSREGGALFPLPPFLFLTITFTFQPKIVTRIIGGVTLSDLLDKPWQQV